MDTAPLLDTDAQRQCPAEALTDVMELHGGIRGGFEGQNWGAYAMDEDELVALDNPMHSPS